MAVLEITTMAGCPLMCTYCPQDKLKKSYSGDKYLSLENFRRILEKVPPHVRIDFSGMSEPWANPACSEMLELTLMRGYRVTIYTTLYGMEDPERVAALIVEHAPQIQTICLHLPDLNDNMLGWRPKEYWFKAFETIVNTRFPRLEAMTMDAEGRLHPELERFKLRLPAWQAISRAGSLSTEKPVQMTPAHKSKVMCASTPFYDHNVLLPNGDVVLCCMDYGLKHRIGNLLQQEYRTMFQSEELVRIKKINMTAGFDRCSICKSCNNVAVPLS